MSKFAITDDPNVAIAGVAVFALVVSLVLAAMLPVMSIQTSDVDAQTLADERMRLGEYTGTSMLSATPFKLTGVYTPYVPGMTVNEDENFTPDGWLYGESIAYAEIGKTDTIRLDPDHKSNDILQMDDDQVTYLKTVANWWAEDYTNDDAQWIADVQNFFAGVAHAVLHDVFGMDDYKKEMTTERADYWTYSGYRYYFEPVVKTVIENGNEKTVTTDQISLSIVWYQKLNTQGLSGGLVVYNEKTRAVIQNITMQEIIADYNVTSGHASVYEMNFDGTPVKLAFRFDSKVLDGTVPMTTAFDRGMWTCAFYTNSVNSLLDEDSGMYSISAGNALDTYMQLLTVSYPGLSSPWDIIVWLLCAVPLAVVTLGVVTKFLAILTPSWL